MVMFKREKKAEVKKIKVEFPTTKAERIDSLSRRETEVSKLLARGYKLQEVADALAISYATANTHQTAVYRKLAVNTKSKLIIEYGALLRDKESQLTR